MSQGTQTITKAPAAGSQTDSTAMDLGDFAEAKETSTAKVGRRPSDDEILGIEPEETPAGRRRKAESNGRAVNESGREAGEENLAKGKHGDIADSSPNLQAAMDANPELRQAWEDARAYREAFTTPDEARAALQQLGNLTHMDALFFSHKPEDHAELARMVAEMDPAAFASLAEAMGKFATDVKARETEATQAKRASEQDVLRATAKRDERAETQPAGSTQAQADFFRATNAAAVQSVIDAIGAQVARLLPEKTSQSARNRVVGEIYRELDWTLQANGPFTKQVREAFRSGALDAGHQRAIVSLISGRAKQALPAVAKRVLGEWTSTVVAASQDRRERQRTAEKRVDIAGASRTGSDGQRTMAPKDLDYARLSDADILDL